MDPFGRGFYPPGPTRKFPNSLLHRAEPTAFRRATRLFGLLVVFRDAEQPRNFFRCPFLPGRANAALSFSFHLFRCSRSQLKLRSEESRYALLITRSSLVVTSRRLRPLDVWRQYPHSGYTDVRQGSCSSFPDPGSLRRCSITLVRRGTHPCGRVPPLLPPSSLGLNAALYPARLLQQLLLVKRTQQSQQTLVLNLFAFLRSRLWLAGPCLCLN